MHDTMKTFFARPLRTGGLPAPDTHPEFYADTVTKRAVAWVIDVILISLLTGVAVVLTAFIGAFFLPLLYAVVSFLYRWWSLASGSATPGMRLTSIELRTREGLRFDGATAFLHTRRLLRSRSRSFRCNSSRSC